MNMPTELINNILGIVSTKDAYLLNVFLTVVETHEYLNAILGIISTKLNYFEEVK